MKPLVVALMVAAFAATQLSQKLVSPVIGDSRVPDAYLIDIVRSEDARNPAPVNIMLTDPNAAVRYRAALAAGRIGSETSLAGLIRLLDDESRDVRSMAAFAIGEIESIKAAVPIITRLRVAAVEAKARPAGGVPDLTARLAEAAGKIAGANATDPKAKDLATSILDLLKAEPSDGTTVRLALTAALRARPEGVAPVVAKYLKNDDWRIRADALNTLARLRAKEQLARIRILLSADPEPIVRANSARVLGAAEDRDARGVLIAAAISDPDSRVRVSAIRALSTLKDASAVDPLVERGRVLLREWPANGARTAPAVKSELLEIATALGGIVPNSKRPNAWRFLTDLRVVDRHYSPEIEVAMAKIDPAGFIEVSNIGGVYVERGKRRPGFDWRVAANLHSALAEYAALPQGDPLRKRAEQRLAAFLNDPLNGSRTADSVTAYPAIPGALDAYARFKPADLDGVLRRYLSHPDPFVRAGAAVTIADQPLTPTNVDALISAFARSYIIDKHDNDALLAILDAAYKLDKRRSVGILLNALIAPDYLVRKKAFGMLSDKDLQKDFPGIEFSLARARNEHRDVVQPYMQVWGTKLGQVLNTKSDYRRALSRKNGSVKAVLTTEKGAFTTVFDPEQAPLTVDNFIRLARARYFDGLDVHRVVPNFVMQDGDPRGDGNGGPGWSIRCEINTLEYDRGAVGMALSGKDTGGSQWFVTHSPQPHLDGGYTVFGHVSEADMKVVDKIVRGDRIVSVRIIGR